MSLISYSVSRVGGPDRTGAPTSTRPLHRVGIVRRLQGISRRAVARQLNMEVSRLKYHERETSDMLLSTLYEWQEVLEVPVAELLVEADDPLSAPVLKRAQLVRLMKTALAILEDARQVSIRRMAQTLVEQFIEVMPELEGVSSWHAVGKRRGHDDYGITAERRLSDDVFLDLTD